MSFYDLSKEERKKTAERIKLQLVADLRENTNHYYLRYFSDNDTYIRKAAYQAVGHIYKHNLDLRARILSHLYFLFENSDDKVRQSVINAAGEIGKHDFSPIDRLMENGLFDNAHEVRNAVIGSLKKMGEVNPAPTLHFAHQFINHPSKEIRREICHGIELRGRMYPQDILPLLKELQWDETARVRNTLIHVLGQIAYKEGCLATVVKELKRWENNELVKEAFEEIIDVHRRYSNFAVLSQKEAKEYIRDNC